MKTLIALVFAVVLKAASSRPGGPFDNLFGNSGGFGDLFKDFNDNSSWKTSSFKESPFSSFDMSSLLGSNMDLSELGEPVVKSKTFGPVTKQDGPVTSTFGGSVHTAQWGPKILSSSSPGGFSGSGKPSPSCGNKSSSGSVTKYPGDNMLSDKAKNNPWGRSESGSSTPLTSPGTSYSKLYEPPAPQQRPQGLSQSSSSSPSPYASKSGTGNGMYSPSYSPSKSGASTPTYPPSKPYGASTPTYSPSKSPGASAPTSPSNKPSSSSSNSWATKGADLPDVLDEDIVPISQVFVANIPYIGGEVKVEINTDGLTADEVEPFTQNVQQKMEEYFGVQVESQPMENFNAYN